MARGTWKGVWKSPAALPLMATATRNSFQSLSSQTGRITSIAESAAELDRLNDFAHKLHVGKRVSQSERRHKSRDQFNSLMAEAKKENARYRVFRSENNLDKPEKRNIINKLALPQGAKSLAKLAKKCPLGEEELAANEIWCMADTGSTLHGIDVRKELPAY